MTLIIECALLCAAFTVMVYVMARDPIKTLYNYPPAIQERVKRLERYRGMIPTQKNKLTAKVGASLLFVIVLSLILRYANGCASFGEAFGEGMILWSAVNLWDLIVLDIVWFCHDPRFVLEGTEDMTDAYHDYMFHFRGFCIGEALAVAVCAVSAAVVQFIL
ncbi:MAG: hypothetical protein IKD81_04695 [Eubacteriaceae bacterium]|nr:hypothetical protein [Eubacteriaceae bacterium]